AGAADVQVTRRISKQGVEALTAEERAGLDLDTPLPEAEQASLMKELAGAHCGMMPESALPAMASVQRFRDAKMAAEMNAAQGKAVLIAGSGHTRRDRGVPFLMDRPVISIALVEVVDGMTTADAYGLVNDAGNPTADFVIFTPRAKRDDPCEAMREAMKNRTK
ncbi:MAG: ChaN family lipoprotein, partial [Pseudomonadota bacterium]